MVLSLYAKGLTTGEISAHFEEIYGASVSKENDQPDHRQGARADGLWVPITLSQALTWSLVLDEGWSV